jgi:hypothetical protein
VEKLTETELLTPKNINRSVCYTIFKFISKFSTP